MAKKSIKSKKTSELDNLNFADGKVHEDPDIARVKEIEKALGYYKGLIGYLEDFKVQIRINYIVVMCK